MPELDTSSSAKKTAQAALLINKKRIPLFWLQRLVVALVLVTLGMGVGYQAGQGKLPFGLSKYIPFEVFASPRPLTKDNLDFSLFWEVWETLERDHIDPDKIDPQTMIYGAIEGMTASVGDPYTVFLPPKENQRSKDDLDGAFEGVGIQLGYKKDTVAVMAPLDGMPASKQDVKAGDLILNIKDEKQNIDQDTIGMTLQEAVLLIRGPKSSAVTLTLYREGKGTFDVSIVRDTITVPSVDITFGNVVDGAWQEDAGGSVALLKLNRFGERTYEEWADAVYAISSKNNQVKGMVLDLRNNPGGYLLGAVDFASEFIGEGVIVKQQNRFATQEYTVSKKGRLIGIPMTILVNGGSASASEILAGALRDRLGTKLVGERSFGKGTVQEAKDLTGGAGLHVTTSRWLLPSGTWIHEDGLKPDVEIAADDPEATASGELIDIQLIKAVSTLEEQLQ
jgi:carboxyl-terminal processing protease